MIKWNNLPPCMQNEAVEYYYDILKKKRLSLICKRIFDLIVSALALVILSPVIAAIAVLIRLDSPGRIIFRQKRITKYGKEFYIYKFRTMVENAEQLGTQVTVNNDSRVTGIGKILRKYRLDEFPQLINIIKGEMSFVGTRPEVEKYVGQYTPEMFATLLMPSGVTSLASICYKDEERLLSEATDADHTYVYNILPKKMQYNLEYLKNFNILYDFKLMIMTVLAVGGKDYGNIDINKKAEAEIAEEIK